MKRLVRTTIGIIVLAALLAVLFLEERQAAEISVEAGETAARPSWEEITGMRGENVQVFKRSPGSFVMRSYARKKFYFDQNDSTYRAADLTVRDISALARLNPLRTHDRYVDAGPYQATWFENAPHDYTFRTETGRVTFTALFDTAGIDITTECRADGVKQTLVIRDETAVHDLSWQVGTDTAAIFEDHRLVFRSEAGEIAAVMPKLTAWDARGLRVPVTDAWDEKLLRAWIDVPIGAQYPITVDPSIVVGEEDATTGTISYEGAGSWLGARDQATGTNTYADYIFVGGKEDGEPAWHNMRSIIRSNTSSVPTGATIDSVKAVFFLEIDYVTTNDFYIHLIKAADALTVTDLTTAQYNDFDGWEASGAYTGAVDISDSISTAGVVADDSLVFRFNTAGKNIINTNGVTQYYMIAGFDLSTEGVAENDSRLVRIYDDTPYMVIYYTTRTPVAYGNTAYYSTDGGTYTTARNATTGSTTGTYYVGQQDENPGFNVYRLFYGYDLTDIPTTATCDSVKWRFRGSADHSTTDFLLAITAANFAGGPAAGWFNDFYGWTSNNAYPGLVSLAPPWNSSGYGTGWVTMTFSAAGRDTAEAAFGDTLRVMAISLKDSTMSEPTGDEYITLDNTSGNQPSLDVYYTLNPPAAPSGLAATDSTATTVTLSWSDNSDNEAGFFIKDAADTTTVKAVSANDTTTTVTGLTPDTGYTFYLVGYNDSGESAPSDSVSFSTPYALPDSLVMTVISPESILVAWNDYSGGACAYLLMNLQDTTVVAGTDSIWGASIGVGGLGPNTFHAWCLKDCLEDSLLVAVSDSACTFANTPGATQVFFAGGREYDLSGTGNHGTVHHARFTVGGAAGSYGSYEFGTGYGGTAESGAWIEAGNDGSLNPDAGDFSVAVFFSTDGAAGDTMSIAVKADSDNGYGLAILPDNTIEAWLRKDAATIGAGGTATVHDSTWHSLAASFDRDDSMRVYFDGAWYGAAALSSLAGTVATDSSFTLGAPNEDGRFSGYLDDVRLYTRALTADEAESLACGGSVGSDSLKLRLAFDLPPSLLRFIIDPNDNPASTKFAVQDSVSGFYLDVTAEPETLRSGALGEWGWGTSAQWGAALGDTLTGMVPDSLVVIRAKARSGD